MYAMFSWVARSAVGTRAIFVSIVSARGMPVR
jgi:hypothetical protein